ncbi:hypothetical protein Dimus_025443 [Dionaea muscipula]
MAQTWVFFPALGGLLGIDGDRVACVSDVLKGGGSPSMPTSVSAPLPLGCHGSAKADASDDVSCDGIASAPRCGPGVDGSHLVGGDSGFHAEVSDGDDGRGKDKTVGGSAWRPGQQRISVH